MTVCDVTAVTDTNATLVIQAALNANSVVKLSDGVFNISQLELQSDQALILSPRTILRRIAGSHNAQMLHLAGKSNVAVYGNGGTIDGNKQEDPEGASHCIGVQGCQDVLIENLGVKNAPSNASFESYGDGIYLGSGSTRNSNIRLLGICSLNNDRHGLFVVDCDGVLVSSSKFDSSHYTALNFEPNGASEVIRNITMRDCSIHNALGGSGFTANNHYSGEWYNILLERCRFENNAGYGAYCGIGATTRNFGFRDCMWSGNASTGLFMGGCNWWIEGGEIRESGGNSFGLYAYQPSRFSINGLRLFKNALSGALIYFPSSADVADGVISNVLACDNGRGGEITEYAASGIAIDRGSNNVGVDLNLRVSSCIFSGQPFGLSAMHEMQGLSVI